MAKRLRRLRGAGSSNTDPVIKKLQDLERSNFHLWSYIAQEGLWEEASECVNDHADDEVPFLSYRHS